MTSDIEIPHRPPFNRWTRGSPKLQNNNDTQTYCELFYQTIHKHTTYKTNRSIKRATHKIQGYNITLTTTEIQEAIKQCKNNNSQGPDKLNIRYLQHIDPLGLAFLTRLKLLLHLHNTTHMEVPISKPNKDIDMVTSYRPISLLSVIENTLEKRLLPYITATYQTHPRNTGTKRNTLQWRNYTH